MLAVGGVGGGERAQKKEGPAKGRDRTESHNKEYKKRRAQKRESTNNSMPKVSTFVTC